MQAKRVRTYLASLSSPNMTTWGSCPESSGNKVPWARSKASGPWILVWKDGVGRHRGGLMLLFLVQESESGGGGSSSSRLCLHSPHGRMCHWGDTRRSSLGLFLTHGYPHWCQSGFFELTGLVMCSGWLNVVVGWRRSPCERHMISLHVTAKSCARLSCWWWR